MKKTKLPLLAALVLALSILSGCHAGIGTADKIPGLLFSDTTYGESGTGSIAKVGTATCETFLGLIAVGDCSIRTAALNGGISEVGSVSRKVKNYVGVFAQYTTVVTGR